MEIGEKEEVMVKAVKELFKSTAKSLISAEWSMDNGLICYREKIYVPNSNL